ncbi:unnamed protein product [Phyllotreta striolata]|uniref:Uncharacterized protein n=1 Tax=Phyllotreta striolata TaxID=444603 RepID=A0A9N9TUM2_PHYSR|nr:unnamed protein product [Phyllotreta striolata]
MEQPQIANVQNNPTLELSKHGRISTPVLEKKKPFGTVDRQFEKFCEHLANAPRNVHLRGSLKNKHDFVSGHLVERVIKEDAKNAPNRKENACYEGGKANVRFQGKEEKSTKITENRKITVINALAKAMTSKRELWLTSKKFVKKDGKRNINFRMYI